MSVHHPHLAHHFDDTRQQFEAAKLGMWLFLATELLLFGGLFCVYAVYRRNHEDVFTYGSQFLDTRWGAFNTAVLILSSLTMAMAVSAAQIGHKRLLIGLLMATFLGGATFMAVKYVEYYHKFHEHLVWSTAFYEQPDWVRTMAAAGPGPTTDEGGAGGIVAERGGAPDPGNGKQLWSATCRSCHGAGGEGVAGQGKDLRGNPFVTEKTDLDLLAFIQVGRPAADPLNTTGVAMLPRGGNPLLSDGDLLDIISFVRTFAGEDGAGGDGAGDGEPGGQDGAAGSAVAAAAEEFWIPSSSLPPAAAGPAGLAPAIVGPAPGPAEPVHHPHHSVDPDRPANAHVFFGLYFCMTGLHGIHVLAGMGLMIWLTVRAIRGHFGPEYFTPVDLGGLYWHVVDLIWIFLFPLFYLIG